MHNEQSPINGNEELDRLDGPLHALAEFYAAFNTRNLEAMSRSWADTDDVVMANPLGGVMRGWEQIRTVYERIFTGRARVCVEFYDYTVHHAGDLFYAVGRERGQAETPSGKLDVQIRTTRVFRQLGGRWRQVHHHGSFDDPQQLATYQSLV